MTSIMEFKSGVVEITALRFAVILLVLHVPVDTAQPLVQHTITPAGSSCSEGESCITLTECLNNVKSCLHSQATVRFLPGDHHTGDVAGFVVVKYVDDLTITSHVESGVPTVGIHCSKGVGFAFVKIRI